MNKLYYIRSKLVSKETAIYDTSSYFKKEFDIELVDPNLPIYIKQNPGKYICIGGDQSGTLIAIDLFHKIYDDLKILWFDDRPDIDNLNSSTFSSSNALGYIINHIKIKPENILLVGIDEKNDLTYLHSNALPYLSLQKLSSIRQEDCLEFINHFIRHSHIYISMDAKVFGDYTNIINSKFLKPILMNIKDNIVACDIVDYSINTPHYDKIRSCILKCLEYTFDVKQKSINIFTEDSEFLIFRPMYQHDLFSDIGWYILRGLDLKTKQELVKNIAHDTIINLEIDDEDYLVTKTTINEQNKKSYYTENTIEDCVLFPDEKKSMLFEL